MALFVCGVDRDRSAAGVTGQFGRGSDEVVKRVMSPISAIRTAAEMWLIPVISNS